MVNIEGLSRAAVLAALWNASRGNGISVLFCHRQEEMTPEIAAEYLKVDSRFDYLDGRVMKLRLPEGAKEFNPALYDRDNGAGAAQSVIDTLRGAA